MSISSTTELSKALIIAVDDEPVNLFLLEDIIEDRYQVLLAESGEACFEHLQSVKPDLILLDINMPGINGFEVCEKLKNTPDLKDIPVIFLTAMMGAEDERRGLQLGAVDYITKPFTESILLARIGTHLKLGVTRKQLQQSLKVLKQEYEYIEQIISSMRYDPRFEQKQLKQILSPVENSNGDIVLSASHGSRQHLIVGDFTGHGLTAAIAGPLVSSLFYSNVNKGLAAEDILQLINDELFNKLPVDKFLAATYVEWDKSRQKLTIFNFAMPPCLLIDAKGGVRQFESQALPLGVVEQTAHRKPMSSAFVPGDSLYVFSDGIVEAQNKAAQPFSVENLEECIINIKRQGRGLESLLDDLQRFVQSNRYLDDITIVELNAEIEQCDSDRESAPLFYSITS